MPLYGDQHDAKSGNGKVAKALAVLAGSIAAAFLAADAANNQKEADKHFAEAARLQKKSDDILSGKSGGRYQSGKGKPKSGGKTIWDIYGDDRGGFAKEDLLPSPNAASYGKAGL